MSATAIDLSTTSSTSPSTVESTESDPSGIAADALLIGDVIVEAGARIGPRCVVGAPLHAGARRPTRIGRDAVIGANATIAAGVSIGRGVTVAPGSAVLADVPPMTSVSGNPARIDGYTSTMAPSARTLPRRAATPGRLDVPGAELLDLTLVEDLRGTLTAIEHGRLPFLPQRSFIISRVPSEELRGQHAHRTLHQILICLAGAVNVMVDDGHRLDEVRLDNPGVGLHIPPMIWGVQYRYTADAVLLVLASAPYDDADYIRDYEEFLVLVHGVS